MNEVKVDPKEELPDYRNYDQTVEVYNLYKSTEKADLSAYLKRPKIGKVYKFSPGFMESMKIKRDSNTRWGFKNRCNVTISNFFRSTFNYI